MDLVNVPFFIFRPIPTPTKQCKLDYNVCSQTCDRVHRLASLPRIYFLPFFFFFPFHESHMNKPFLAGGIHFSHVMSGGSVARGEIIRVIFSLTDTSPSVVNNFNYPCHFQNELGRNVQNQQKYVSWLLVTEESFFYLPSLRWKPFFLLNGELVQKRGHVSLAVRCNCSPACFGFFIFLCFILPNSKFLLVLMYHSPAQSLPPPTVSVFPYAPTVSVQQRHAQFSVPLPWQIPGLAFLLLPLLLTTVNLEVSTSVSL